MAEDIKGKLFIYSFLGGFSIREETPENPLGHLILDVQDEDMAQLIVAAVNSCIQINPSNPMAVAEGMGAVFETLKPILEMIECGLPVMGVPFDQFKQSLAKITGGK